MEGVNTLYKGVLNRVLTRFRKGVNTLYKDY